MSCLFPHPNRKQAGVTLPELIVVVAILALGLMISVPAISTRIQRVRCRAASDQLAASLRAVRMVSVTTAQPVSVAIFPHPDNRYSWVDSSGATREVRLPQGARITAAPATIDFLPNGSVASASTIRLRSTLSSGSEEAWEVRIAISGIPVSRRE